MRKLLLILALFSVSGLFSQQLESAELEELASKFTKASFPIYRELLSIPSDANYPEDIELNVQWCENAFQNRNFTTTRIKTENVPLLLAERKAKSAQKTVLIYLQLDGQPVDNTKWHQESPWVPVLKQQNEKGDWEQIPWENIENYEDDWRVFARAASDAKGPVAMFLAALDAIESQNIEPNFNMKVIMDFEEELGSPHLPQAVKDNSDLLSADMLIILDGPVHNSNKPTLVFGARGIAQMQLTTYGPIVPQHSGHYGNYAPNPALRLSKLLASMKDDDGRVTIPGFYDSVHIDAATEKILKSVPDDETEIKNRLKIVKPDKVGSYYQEAIQYPSLNILGMESGWVREQTRTIVPSKAIAELDMRLVQGSDPQRLIGLVQKHIEAQGYYVIGKEPTDEERMKYDKIATFTHKVFYHSFQTDFNTEVGQWLQRAYDRAYAVDPIRIRMGGGSIPISPFVTTLGIPAVLVTTVNSDNNQHSPNENLRLGNYREGVKAMIAFLTEDL
ncbi:M20/M25/M40 family metallo-hydrolase [Flagellimonas sp.]|uniref:M20/M25/M40 family metallo-hydrolase n=1 Tax=Flagellimonas sp. TaxID=2058762 RepID=UPI003BAF6AA0